MVKPAETLPQLRLHLLGPPRVLLGEVPVTFARRKALALLAYLALSGRAHSRDALAALLSEASSDDEAREQLRTILVDLRRQVGAYLAVTHATVALAPGCPVWVDLVELETAAQGETIDAERLARVVSLCTGEFLAGFTLTNAPDFAAWLLREREHTGVLLRGALTRLIEHHSRQGDLPAAICWARQLLAEEPWHEPTHRHLMRLLARAGEREAALAQYEVCRRTLVEDLGSVPQPETIALYEQLHTSPTAPPTNLPAPQAGFIGREAELAGIAARLADPACRLLTLVGLGGSGKTSLALRAAVDQARPAALLDEHPFAGGVYLVDLASIAAPGRAPDQAAVAAQHLTMTIGRALGLEFRRGDPVVHLLGWLRARAVLLVLDNVEHLREGAAVLTLLLQGARGLKLLVTSRERLRLPDEWALEVGGLPLPAGPDDLEQAPASRLYLQLMYQAGGGRLADTVEREAIVHICGLTQGVPLALVLTARWTPILPPAAIAQELAADLHLLDLPAQGLPERQRSMRAVLQSTWKRLSDQERAALRRLAVFEPGFTREATQVVAGVQLDALLALGEAALLGRDPDSERYAMHEFVRQYAAEQLRRRPREGELRARHANFYADLVERLAPVLRQSSTAMSALSADMANIRLAWDWAVERIDVAILERMLDGVARWHELQGLPGQFVEALERAEESLRANLATAGAPGAAAQRLLGFVLVEKALALHWQGAATRPFPLLEEALALARATASPHLGARASHAFAWLLGLPHDLFVAGSTPGVPAGGGSGRGARRTALALRDRDGSGAGRAGTGGHGSGGSTHGREPAAPAARRPAGSGGTDAGVPDCLPGSS
jgi:DNA-binding SARP family transcriptional activator/predicted ATPase